MLHIGFKAHIGPNEFGICTEGAQFIGKCMTGLFTTAAHDQMGAFFGECYGGGTANTCEGTCDQDDFGVHVVTPSK
ncbi:hypothetical protein GCM10011408_10970 [Dyella caseinilytica]|nr:hypothetical protein GCM10011408_10970 [Dyella caseinilytica]